MSIAFMFLLQTGLALLTLLAASFCAAYHFFSQPAPQLSRDYCSKEWGQRFAAAALHGKSRKLNSAPAEPPRGRHGGKPGPQAVRFLLFVYFRIYFPKSSSNFPFFAENGEQPAGRRSSRRGRCAALQPESSKALRGKLLQTAVCCSLQQQKSICCRPEPVRNLEKTQEALWSLLAAPGTLCPGLQPTRYCLCCPQSLHTPQLLP